VAATRQVPDQLLQIQQEILLRQILQSVTPAQMQVCSISPSSCAGVTQTISHLLRISTSLQDQVHKQLPQAAIQKNGERLISHSDIPVKFLMPRPKPLRASQSSQGTSLSACRQQPSCSNRQQQEQQQHHLPLRSSPR
jgi:hypothetical protein